MSNLYAENLSSVTSLIASGDLVVNSAEVAGGLKIPVKTEAERDALTGIQPGMIVYNSTSNQVQSYANSDDGWEDLVPTTGIAIYKVQLWGAGGSGGRQGGWDYGADGGGGGYTEAELVNLTSGQNLILQVGQAGQASSGDTLYGGGGGNCHNANNCQYGGRGGGYTGLFLGSVSHANAILIAGGGGAGGSSRAQEGNIGGAGGGECGQDGRSPYDDKITYRGRGGSGAAAGDLGDSDNQNGAYQAAGPLKGGSPRFNSYGGGGGGGYYGGSAGNYSEQHTMAGGGGGSGYIDYDYCINWATETGEYRQPAGGGKPGYPGGGISFGGQQGTSGGAGFARITRLSDNNVTTYNYTGSDVTITVP
jgi:hypothetical protein